MEEKNVRVGSHEIRIHELTTEDESMIRTASQVWDQRRKIWETNRAILDASYITYSVDSSTWPKEWGPLTIENVRKLPAKLTRKLFIECNKLNTLNEDAADFLEAPEQSQVSTHTEATPSSTQ
ncbi:MAG: hypothetical protein JRN20_09690 [Nitrososphaerota archaeon]|jgi:hypothetical protein|nr:hypothetical protein [Nitrososphaerota archaeon]